MTKRPFSMPSDVRQPPSDVFVAVGFLLVLAVFCIGASFLGFTFGLMTDGCVESTCSDAAIFVGMNTAVFGPWVIFFTTIIWLVVRYSRRKRLWWLPLVGAGLVALIASVGWAIVAYGTDSF